MRLLSRLPHLDRIIHTPRSVGIIQAALGRAVPIPQNRILRVPQNSLASQWRAVAGVAFHLCCHRKPKPPRFGSEAGVDRSARRMESYAGLLRVAPPSAITQGLCLHYGYFVVKLHERLFPSNKHPKQMGFTSTFSGAKNIF